MVLTLRGSNVNMAYIEYGFNIINAGEDWINVVNMIEYSRFTR
jgi:hypothetical protein